MDWLFFALTSAVFSAASGLVDRKVLRDALDAAAYSQWIQILGSLVFGAALLVYRPAIPTNPWAWLVALLGGVVWTVFMLYNYQTDAKTDATLKRTVFQSRLLFTLGLSAVFFAEPLSIPKLLSCLLIIAGVAVAATNRARDLPKLFRDSRFALLIFASALGAVANIVDKQATTSFGLLPYVFLAYFIPALLTPLAFSNRRSRMKAVATHNVHWLLVKAFLEPAAFLTLILAFANGPVGQITLIRQVMLPLMFIGGVLFLGERDNLKRRALGATIVLIGSVLAALA